MKPAPRGGKGMAGIKGQDAVLRSSVDAMGLERSVGERGIRASLEMGNWGLSPISLFTGVFLLTRR